MAIDSGYFAEDNNVLTNGDRIRAMTDEELAWELMTWRYDALAKYHGISRIYPNTQKAICEWLKKPLEERP